MDGHQKTHQEIWDTLYSQGKSIMKYPDDIFVRLVSKVLNLKKHKRVLDFGFGSGANLLHLFHNGFQVAGVENSTEAIQIVQDLFLDETDCPVPLKQVLKNSNIPYDDHVFDAVVAWQVLYYNDLKGLQHSLSELFRVLKKGGVLIAALKAPGDHFQTTGKQVNTNLYELNIPGQEGALVLIQNKKELCKLFPREGRLKFGYYNYNFEGRVNANYIIIYEKQ